MSTRKRCKRCRATKSIEKFISTKNGRERANCNECMGDSGGQMFDPTTKLEWKDFLVRGKISILNKGMV